MNDAWIERKSSIKLLGITNDDKLKFDKHIDIYAKMQQDNLMYCIELVVYILYRWQRSYS